MKKYLIEFTFINANLIHTWTKIFYSNNIEKNINLYLKNKELPFELTINDIKWKILNH